MIQFQRNGTSNLPEGCLEDHLDAGRCFYLPNALAVLESEDRAPDFRLVRYGGDMATVSGGFLSARFELRRDDLDDLALVDPGVRWESVSFEEASARLIVRSHVSGEGIEEGQWHPVVLSGNCQLRLTAHLSATDTSLLASLLVQGAESVELELVLGYRGLVPGIPGFAMIECDGFVDRLRGMVTDQGLRPDEIIAAYLSLSTDGIVGYRPIDATEVSPPAHDVFMAELARRSQELFFRPIEDNGVVGGPLYRLVSREEQPAGNRPIALHTSRTERAEHRLAWSVSALHDALTDPQKRAAHFPVVGEVSPFTDRRINVANSLPFDPAFLRRVVVDVRYTGPSGTFEHCTFRFPDDGEFREVQTRYPSINTGFQLESRVRLLLMPPDGSGWPVFWPDEADFVREDESLVEVTAERAGVSVCQVAVDPGAFTHTSRIACVLRDPQAAGNEPPLASVDLSAGREHAALVIPIPNGGTVPELTCVAFPAEELAGEPIPLFTTSACPKFLQIPAHRLEVLEPDTVRARLSPSSKTGVLFIAVAFKHASDPATSDGQLRTFSLAEEEPSVVWKGWRRSVFENLQYIHRVQFVPTDASGQALPMRFGDWIPGSELELVIELPGNN